MATGGKEDSLENWLSTYFREHTIDEDIYLEYVSGILNNGEDTTNVDELISSIEEVLIGVFEKQEDARSVAVCIVDKFSEYNDHKREETSVQSDLLTQIHEQALNTQGTKKTTPEEKSASSIDQMSSEQKKRLIMTYGVESDEDNCDSEEEETTKHRQSSSGSLRGLLPNVNAATVIEKQKQQREKKKQEHEAKLERDRQSRQKQLQKEQDRKEREKKRTQKQERRR
jgi:hypothetical protein